MLETTLHKLTESASTERMLGKSFAAILSSSTHMLTQTKAILPL